MLSDPKINHATGGFLEGQLWMNDPYKPSNWWLPLRDQRLGSFVFTFPTEHQHVNSGSLKTGGKNTGCVCKLGQPRKRVGAGDPD